ncbi:hypothetical protein ACOBQX_07895 [Actinokineospora sp. G85]|uniref:hypothetical protein n=1 Tax=Actinokineospora sp. G85 TaxID=3406626 RepID=UPI003C790A2A
MAIGHALDLGGDPTVSCGILTGLGRTMQTPAADRGRSPVRVDMVAAVSVRRPGHRQVAPAHRPRRCAAIAGRRVEYVLAAKLVNELVEAAHIRNNQQPPVVAWAAQVGNELTCRCHQSDAPGPYRGDPAFGGT